MFDCFKLETSKAMNLQQQQQVFINDPIKSVYRRKVMPENSPRFRDLLIRSPSAHVTRERVSAWRHVPGSALLNMKEFAALSKLLSRVSAAHINQLFRENATITTWRGKSRLFLTPAGLKGSSVFVVCSSD